jgi:hypothetical protein
MDLLYLAEQSYTVPFIKEGIKFVKVQQLFKSTRVSRRKLRLYGLLMNITGYNSGRFMRYVCELHGCTLDLPLQKWYHKLCALGHAPVRRRR